MAEASLKHVKLSDIQFDTSIYPRLQHSPILAQQYVEVLDAIEAQHKFIAVDAKLRLVDGRHRHLAYLTKYQNEPERSTPVLVYADIETDADAFELAAALNSTHGQQMSEGDKTMAARRMYGEFGKNADEVARALSVRKATVLEWTQNIREEQERQKEQAIFDRWMACYTQQEIADATGVVQKTVSNKIEKFSNSVPGNQVAKFSDSDWTPPIYNIWNFAKKTNDIKHFGNSEQRIVENLLYLYTEPLDIVLDPFAGGGSTIDVCLKRGRRYWCSDRKPTPVRQWHIRTLDVAQEMPTPPSWQDVTLTYLDPPYWIQAKGEYSNDAEDLANMPLEVFTKTLTGIVKRIAAKQQRGVIALLIQPTQWKAPERKVVDHIIDLISAIGNKRLALETRISCPYATEQYNAQQVEWAKANRKLLVLTRELIVWRIIE